MFKSGLVSPVLICLVSPVLIFFVAKPNPSLFLFGDSRGVIVIESLDCSGNKNFLLPVLEGDG